MHAHTYLLNAYIFFKLKTFISGICTRKFLCRELRVILCIVTRITSCVMYSIENYDCVVHSVENYKLYYLCIQLAIGV